MVQTTSISTATTSKATAQTREDIAARRLAALGLSSNSGSAPSPSARPVTEPINDLPTATASLSNPPFSSASANIPVATAIVIDSSAINKLVV
jgi:hypothetical protein